MHGRPSAAASSCCTAAPLLLSVGLSASSTSKLHMPDSLVSASDTLLHGVTCREVVVSEQERAGQLLLGALRSNSDQRGRCKQQHPNPARTS
jgi:hypothetical protein